MCILVHVSCRGFRLLTPLHNSSCVWQHHHVPISNARGFSHCVQSISALVSLSSFAFEATVHARSASAPCFNAIVHARITRCPLFRSYYASHERTPTRATAATIGELCVCTLPEPGAVVGVPVGDEDVVLLLVVVGVEDCDGVVSVLVRGEETVVVTVDEGEADVDCIGPPGFVMLTEPEADPVGGITGPGPPMLGTGVKDSGRDGLIPPPPCGAATAVVASRTNAQGASTCNGLILRTSLTFYSLSSPRKVFI